MALEVVAGFGNLFEDAHGDMQTGELERGGHTRGTGTDDENLRRLRVHRDLLHPI